MNKSFTPPGRKKFNQINLSMSTKQILLGSLLGDGSLKIAKNYKNARFSERHSMVQEDYLRWKFSQLNTELKGVISICKPEKSSYSKHAKIIYQSATNENLTGLHHLTHIRNQKVIKRNWLNNLTALGLAVWWCDDGSLNVLKRQGVFCTDDFSRPEQIILARYLEVDWGIHCKIIENPVKNKHKETIRVDYRLRFSTFENLQAFFRLILPFIPVPSMLYKIMICYDDPIYQQRWISEVKQALPYFSSEIITIYETPFLRYQHLVKKIPDLTFRDIFYQTEKFKRRLSENDIVQ
jgi:LAGLIDADG DNA endonuclease family